MKHEWQIRRLVLQPVCQEIDVLASEISKGHAFFEDASALADTTTIVVAKHFDAFRCLVTKRVPPWLCRSCAARMRMARLGSYASDGLVHLVQHRV